MGLSSQSLVLVLTIKPKQSRDKTRGTNKVKWTQLKWPQEKSGIRQRRDKSLV